MINTIMVTFVISIYKKNVEMPFRWIWHLDLTLLHSMLHSVCTPRMNEFANTLRKPAVPSSISSASRWMSVSGLSVFGHVGVNVACIASGAILVRRNAAVKWSCMWEIHASYKQCELHHNRKRGLTLNF